ncbi:MAG: hypothetical protein OEY41_11810 [Acidimicrobiia bacterium]|nr:hypothetical protein [Acidimicrobiia bacterium]
MTGPQSPAGNRRKGIVQELAVAKYLAANGFPHAERRGGGFCGSDIVGTPGLTFEVKAQAGAKLATWADQTEQARAAAGDTYGVLVAKRAGTTDVGRWLAVLPMAQLMALLAEAGWTAPDQGTKARVMHNSDYTAERSD